MTKLYPDIAIERIRRPNRLYAIPLFGFLYKVITTLPVSIEIALLRTIVFFASILNSFNIFFRGRYWKWAYDINLGTMRLETNLAYFLFGLTDKYPGFSLVTTPDYTMNLPYNKKPNRLYAIPFLGYLIRTILMIPYLLYRHVLNMAAFLAIMVSWVSVLFRRRYPETTYEIVRDSVRVDQATSAYFWGMSDEYPSWWISMNHKWLKILLLVLATIFTFLSFVANQSQKQQRKYEQNLYQYSRTLPSSQSAY